MAIYKITSHDGSGRPLTWPGNNVLLSDNKDYSTQQWVVSALSGTQQFKSRYDESYMLHANRSTWNCDVSNGSSDTSIIFVALETNRFRLQLASDTTKYLTAEANSNGSNVSWQAFNNASSQIWKFDVAPSSSVTSKTLTMPVNLCHKYSALPTWINNGGCLLTCLTDVASYYDSDRNYTIQDLINAGVVIPESTDIVGIGKVPKASFTNVDTGTDASFRSKIKSEIEAGRPVLIHYFSPSKTDQHWVVAFKFTNSAATYDDIEVLDPANGSASVNGAVRTLTASMNYNFKAVTNINKIRLTQAK